MDAKLKYCLALMSPSDTFLMRGESDEETDEWMDMLMTAVIPARALHFGRPVLPTEFFGA